MLFMFKLKLKYPDVINKKQKHRSRDREKERQTDIKTDRQINRQKKVNVRKSK